MEKKSAISDSASVMRQNL